MSEQQTCQGKTLRNQPVAKVATESQEQQALARYLDELGVLYTATAAGRLTSRRTGAKLVREGLKRGVPDILIFDCPPRMPRGFGVAIELKRAGSKHLTTGRPTTDQRWWLDQLKGRGWLTRVCHGAEDAKAWLRSLGWG